MARLIWERDRQVIKEYPLLKGSVTIGRRKENTIVFPNPEVSSSHARIDKVGTDYILTDLQSTNGTLVNGSKVLSHRLSHGDRIRIGKNVLVFIGTEKAKTEAERANIPLDQTVIIGATRHRKTTSIPGAKIKPHYIEPTRSRNYLRVLFFGVLTVGVVVFGVFIATDKTFFQKGGMPKANQGQRTETTAVSPSLEEGKTSQPGDDSLPRTSEVPESPSLDEENLGAGDTRRSSISIEAIVWSSDAKKSFVVIKGVEFRVGDLVEGKTLTRIERDHVVLQSQEGESIARLKLK